MSETAAKPAVIVEKEGHVLIVTLNRPEKKNCVNSEVMCRLYDAWVELDRDPNLRVAILTGNGDTFCAGMDLSEIPKLRTGKPENEWMARVMKDSNISLACWLKTYRPTKPVILAADQSWCVTNAGRGDDPAERERLWTIAVEAYPPYQDYQAKTQRQIPVLIAEPV